MPSIDETRFATLISAWKSSSRLIRVSWVSASTGVTLILDGELDANSSVKHILVKGSCQNSATVSLSDPSIENVQEYGGGIQILFKSGAALRVLPASAQSR